MKRPEGVAAPTTQRPTTQHPTTQRPKAQRPTVQSPTAPVSTGPTPSTAKSAAPRAATAATSRRNERMVAAESARAARRELRDAERARKRFERSEMKRFTRRARRRRLSWLVTLGLLLTIVALVIVAVFSPLLALRSIRIDGVSRVKASDLNKAVDSQLGTPLALLDYGELTRELAPFSLIRSYSTEIIPPGTLVIHVVERSPIGAIQGANDFDLVDPAGVVVSTSLTRPVGYPLIQLGAGRVTGPGFASMAQVLLALPTPLLSKVDTITAQTHDDVTLTLTGSNQRVVWGSSDDSPAKAQLLADLIALHSGSGAGEYDVSAPSMAVFHQDGS